MDSTQSTVRAVNFINSVTVKGYYIQVTIVLMAALTFMSQHNNSTQTTQILEVSEP
jgi:uncharacterized membrane protein